MNQKLIDLAAWLRANPVPNLDMRTWCSENEYGTTYCIMGWVAKNKMFGFYLSDLGTPRHIEAYSDSLSLVSIDVGLNIHRLTATDLFSFNSNLGLSFEQIVDKIEEAGKFPLLVNIRSMFK
jgi:hypothetical protein